VWCGEGTVDDGNSVGRCAAVSGGGVALAVAAATTAALASAALIGTDLRALLLAAASAVAGCRQADATGGRGDAAMAAGTCPCSVWPAGGGLGRLRPGLSGAPSLLSLCCRFGVAKVVGPGGCLGCLWCHGGAVGCVGSLSVAVLWRRGAGSYHDFERATGVVQSGESLHRLLVGVMTALFGRRSPCRGHHGEVLRSRRVGFSRGNLVHLDV
jgi:hypothetical protein